VPFPPARIAGRAETIRRFLERSDAPWLIVGLALLLSMPSLFTGLCADDFIHQLLLRKDPGIAGLAFRPLDLFAFADGDPTRTHQLINEGMYPWWTDPDVVLAFLRPITSATHYLDHLLWPSQPVLMHLHSLLWFALLLVVVGTVYRRFLRTGWIASLALLLFAIDDARAPTLGWLANRNALVALTLSLPALIAHDKWRRDGSGHGAWLGPLALGIGLLAGEAALVVVAYLLAYALFIDQGLLRARLLRLAPYALVVLVWRAAYVHLGYGSVGSGVYLDPGRDLLGFLAAAATRLPVMLLAQFALPPADLWDLYPLIFPAGRALTLLVALVVLAALGAAIVPLWKRDPVIRFWTVGCLLSTLIMCATFPHDRLLTGISLGAMALVAELLAAFIQSGARGRLASIVAGTLVFCHVGVAPLLFPFRAQATTSVNRVLGRAHQSVPADAAVTSRSVVLVNPPIDPFVGYFLAYRTAASEPRPKHLRWFATGVTALWINRVDETTLRIRPRAGFLSSFTQMMLRSSNRPIGLGQRIALSDVTIEVSALTADGRPSEILVRFAVPLEHPSLQWLQWGKHDYVPFRVPRVGETTVVPAVDMSEMMFG
jgi:hypothetical protein